MPRTKKRTLLRAAPSPPGSPAAALHAPTPGESLWKKLTKPRGHSGNTVKRRDLVFIFRNLATLTENGVSLPKAIGTLADEKPLHAHREMLLSIRRHMENGGTFSAALARYSNTFDTIMINQIKVGERSGTLPDTLAAIATHCDDSNRLRSEVIRKLSYPIILIVLGTCVIGFLLIYVVPVFEVTYSKAKVPLPFITQMLISIGAAAKHFGGYLLGGLVLAVLIIRHLRKRPKIAYQMDLAILRLPIVGHWVRDLAVLRLMETMGNLLEAGFTLADALGESVQAVGNRAVQEGVRDLQSAVRRGERFSREIESHGELYPPIVSQLVIVGEQTGKLGSAAKHICEHLEREIRRKTTLFVSALEPVLTISLAVAVAIILLSIYLPMFDMIKVVGK
jgi:type II secretory pathway component PulF